MLFLGRSVEQMDSDRKDIVEPTRVRLYHRKDTSPSQPFKWKTPTDTDYTLKATLVRTSSNRHEIQVLHEPEMDPRSPKNGLGSALGSPRNRSEMDPGFPRSGSGSELVVAFDLKAIKSCVIKGKVWIEIPDSSSGLRFVLEFMEDDPNFLAFDQRLMTLFKLLGVKCKMNDSFDRAKWSEITYSPRALPPLPAEPPHGDAAGEDEDYPFVYTRCNLKFTTTPWPTMPPPPSPSSNPPLRKVGQVLPSVNRRNSGRSSADSINTESISNSNNTMLSSSDGTTSDDDDYLIPVDTRAHYVNVRQMERRTSSPRNNPPPPVLKTRSVSQKQGTSWNCSSCTVWNQSTNSRCEVCEKPRKTDAVQSSDCKECRRLGLDVSHGCKECSNTSDTNSRSLNCKECLRIGYSTPPECKECRSATGNKSLVCNECKRSGCICSGKDKGCKSTAKPVVRRTSTPPPSSTPSNDKYRCKTTFAAVSTTSNTVSTESTSSSDAKVDRWRCMLCTVLNPANVFFCESCCKTRDDAWQCHVCETVISLDFVRCQRCDVWRCRLCTNQNDARQNRSKFCQACSQPQ